jgi:hypothetical protein
MGGRKGYNPKNKGKKSYQPILTFIAETHELMRRLWRFHSVFTVNVVLPHFRCRLISRKGDQVRDSKPVALSDQTWRGRLGAFSAETLYLTKFQLLAGLWRAEPAP